MLINFQSNAEILEQERKEGAVAREIEHAAARPELENLAGYLRHLWDRAQRAKIDPERQMLKGKRARLGIYEPGKLAAIKALMGEDYDPIFMKLTETKCRAVESWVEDLLFQPGEKPWGMEPTPIPELPPAVQMEIARMAEAALIQEAVVMAQAQGIEPTLADIAAAAQAMMPAVKARMEKMLKDAAKKAAEKMEEKIGDQFAEGKWEDELKKSLYDLSTYGTMIFSGPVLMNQMTRVRDMDPNSGAWSTAYERRPVPNWRRICPLMFYPSPDATKDVLPWAFELVDYTRRDLSDMIGQKGFNEQAIREVLAAHKKQGLREWTAVNQQKYDLENRGTIGFWNTENIQGLVFRGSVPGSLLNEFGIAVPDMEKEYDAIAYLIDRWVIKAVINPNPLGEKYLFTCGFSEDPDSFWQIGVPQLLEPSQALGNASARAIVQNAGIASGPQVEVNTDRLAPGESASIWPYKIWRSTAKGMLESPAVKFYQPELVVRQLMELWEFVQTDADNVTGVPRYTHTGETSSSGAGETATGLSMLMNHAARGIKNVIKNIGQGVIKKSVTAQFDYNMMYEEADGDIIGDLKVIPKGAAAMLQREQETVRRKELLAETNNPVDLQIIGLKGRAQLLRKNLEGLDIDPDKIIADEEQLELMAAQGAAQTAPEPAPQATDAEGAPVAGRDAAVYPTPEGSTP